MDVDYLIRNYGLITGGILYFLWKEFWPWLRDKRYPEYARQKVMDRRNSRRTEDRLFDIAQQNVIVMTGLQKTMEAINQQLPALQNIPALTNAIANMSVMITSLVQDMAGLYGALGQTRPSKSPTSAPPTIEREK